MAKESAKSKKNTSKTARVLGLLTSPPPTEEPLEETRAGARSRPAAPRQMDDQAVESQVRSALESELEDLLPSPGEPAPPEPAPQPEEEAPVLEEEPLFEAPIFEELTSEPEPAGEPAPEPPRAEAPAAPRPAKIHRSVKMQVEPAPELENEEFICFNVMQALVEAKAEKYIKLFGLCGCSRCHTDVVALSLSNLPAKYLVTSNREIVPLLNVFEGTYSAAVISQVMNACKRVMAHPRHKL